MQAFLALSLAFLLSHSAFATSPEPLWRGPWAGLPELVSILKTVPEGRKILYDARAKDPDFLQKIHAGKVSFTESTFSRTYSLLDGKEEIDLHHEITLSQSLRFSDAVLDLAHELVHFTEKDMLDPYKPGFELKQFVQRGIEGQGGELAALERECLLATALKKKYPGFPRHDLCLPYMSRAAGFDREQARKDYYALGPWFDSARQELKDELPVTKKAVVFTSSYARKPYPIALAEEYRATRKVACANNRRKFKLIAAQAAERGRGPASLLNQESRRLKAYDRLYCQPAEPERP